MWLQKSHIWGKETLVLEQPHSRGLHTSYRCCNKSKHVHPSAHVQTCAGTCRIGCVTYAWVHVSRHVPGCVWFCLFTIECLSTCATCVYVSLSTWKKLQSPNRAIINTRKVSPGVGAPSLAWWPPHHPCPLWIKETLGRVCPGEGVHLHLTPISAAERVTHLGEVNFHQWRLAFQWEIYISMHPVIFNLRHLAPSPSRSRLFVGLTSSPATPRLQEPIEDSRAQRHVWVRMEPPGDVCKFHCQGQLKCRPRIVPRGIFVLPGHGRCPRRQESSW